MDALKARHVKLLNEICNEMSEEDHATQNFVELIPGGRGEKQKCKTLRDKLNLLEQKGEIKPGEYGNLKKWLEESGNVNIVEIIKTAEKDMDNIKKDSSSSASSSRAITSSILSPSSSREPGISTNRVTQKRRYEETVEDEGDILIDGKRYYDYRNKQGYMLILEAREGRKASFYDMIELKTFFRNKLNFVVDDPRSFVNEDFTLREFNTHLDAAVQKLDGPDGNNYYCFFCVILSHGNEKGIRTKDGQFLETERIRKKFTNENIPSFTGKPKIFLIQACRGTAGQNGMEIDEEDDEAREEMEDECDVMVKVPNDADTLIAFSTTPGYKSHRRVLESSNFRGSWFIQYCLKVFEDDYQDNHVSDMLITVCNQVAKEYNRSSGAVQMPCVWSTLRARLLLNKS